ncbi:MAG: exonuclease domain-containing protein [Clostridia bacterium]|nr:exonuclease domain-containing protein [Clostridia bacterium]
MQFVVMDLEWNTAYSKKNRGFFNEVIEIGAVKLNESFEIIDKISIIVKPQISKTLRGRTKDLTHITNEDVSQGKVFAQAVKEFSEWLGDDKNVFLTWGDGDIRVLIKNYEYFTGNDNIEYINFYGDAQKYCQSFINTASHQQIGLAAACEQFGINPDDFSHHRALDDSLMTVECIKKVFDREKLKGYIHTCDEGFHKRLLFKPYVIKDMKNPAVDLSKQTCVCDVCGGKVETKKKWRFVNQSFRSEYYCPNCKRYLRLCVRYKQFYDRIDVKRSLTEFSPAKRQIKQKTAE